MKKSVRKHIQSIIDQKFLTDWEFIVEEIAPEIEEEDFDANEVAVMVWNETQKRNMLNTLNMLKDDAFIDPKMKKLYEDVVKLSK
jgi:hypothetical protein